MSSFIRYAGAAALVLSLGLIVSALPLVTSGIVAPVGKDAVSAALIKLCVDLEANVKALLLCTDVAAVKAQVAVLVTIFKGCTDALVNIGSNVVVDPEAKTSIVVCIVSIITLILQVIVKLSLKFGLAVFVDLDICLKALLIALNVCIHDILDLVAKAFASITVGLIHVHLKLCSGVLDSIVLAARRFTLALTVQQALSGNTYESVFETYMAKCYEERKGLAALSFKFERTPLFIVDIFQDLHELWRAYQDPDGRSSHEAHDLRLMPLGDLPEEVVSIVHHSARLTRRESHVLREEAEAALDRYNKLRTHGHANDFNLWVTEREGLTDNRRKMAVELIGFLDKLDKEQNDERNDLKAARRSDVETRLRRQGWVEEDICFEGHYSYKWRKEWLSLVENPKQLTERMWTNLYPKLHVLLAANREARLEKEREERQKARNKCLQRFLSDMKDNISPVFELNFCPARFLYSSSYTHDDIFPDAVDVLEWPFIQAINDEDLSAKDLGKRLQENKNKITALLAQWQHTVRSYMVGLLRTESRSSPPIVQPPESSTSDPFIDLSDDFKLLLRADSLFYLTGPHDGVKVPFSYHEAFEAGHSMYCHDRVGLWVGGLQCPVDLDRFRRYSRAQNVARVILKYM
ncbi:unnamed protein product, partial [Rhizoctonia solani]